jgi:hypothetical protein
MISWNDVLQVTLGTSCCGTLAALAFRLLRIMTRHNILLTGQSLGEVNSGTDAPGQYPRRYRYRLRVQSLEAARTEYPMEVLIKGFPAGSTSPSALDHVWSIAGWKSIDVTKNIGSTVQACGPCADGDAKQPFTWRGVFHELPAFDAWLFDVVLPCERVDISLSFLGIEKSKLLTPTFGPYFQPDQFTVFASDLVEPRVRGPVTLPRPVVPFILSLLALGVYVLWRAFSHWRIDWTEFTGVDLALMAAQLVLIWLGYSMIRRPVYPVISGYRYITPPWPREMSPGPSAAKQPDPPG